jgi:uncharacterized membrane protein YfcA
VQPLSAPGLSEPSDTPRPFAAFLYAVPIGVLGGLIGLGGAEFRLPVLIGPLGYPARQALPLNLAVSLVTLAASLGIRGRTLTLAPLLPLTAAIIALISGAVVAAFIGATLGARLSKARLERIIFFLLVGIGGALIVEGFLPQEGAGLLPLAAAWRVSAGMMFGLMIGLVSSLLGVAGGEIIIPTLVFAFGADIKTAGTASLLISLPTVCVGMLRYSSQGAYTERQALTQTVAPMGVGSVIGALIGGLLVGTIPAPLLKIGLGIILMISAMRTFRHMRTPPS